MTSCWRITERADGLYSLEYRGVNPSGEAPVWWPAYTSTTAGNQAHTWQQVLARLTKEHTK